MTQITHNGKNGHEADGKDTKYGNTVHAGSWRVAIVGAGAEDEQENGLISQVARLLGAQGHMALPVQSEALSANTLENTGGIFAAAFEGLAAQLVGAQPVAVFDFTLPTHAHPVPLVAVPGGVDTVRFDSKAAIPPQFGRRAVVEQPDGSLRMRLDVSESARLGRLLAEQINGYPGIAAVCLPLRGLSAFDIPGQPLYSMEANMALFGNLTTHLNRSIRLYDGNVHIHSAPFARLCVEALLALIEAA